MKNLLNKKILFIICGGISAYKSLETIRLLKKSGAEITIATYPVNAKDATSFGILKTDDENTITSFIEK